MHAVYYKKNQQRLKNNAQTSAREDRDKRERERALNLREEKKINSTQNPYETIIIVIIISVGEKHM